MALSNYDDLKSAIADWLNRQDLTARIPDFIALAEADLNRTLRVRDMLARATASLTGQYTALPTGFLKMEYVQLDIAKDRGLIMRTPEQMRIERLRMYSVSGEPRVFAIVGDSLELAPTPDTTYAGEMGYYAKTAALSDGSPTNWLMTKHPDAYLYGSLVHSAPYLKDDERLSGWVAAYDRIMERIRMEDEAARISGATPRVSFRRLG